MTMIAGSRVVGFVAIVFDAIDGGPNDKFIGGSAPSSVPDNKAKQCT